MSSFWRTFLIELFVIYSSGYEYKKMKSILVCLLGINDGFIGNKDIKSDLSGSLETVSVIVVKVSEEHSEVRALTI